MPAVTLTAVFYALIGNCHREGINATTYLTDLFTRLPSATNRTVHQLAPKAWAAEQASLRQAMRSRPVKPNPVKHPATGPRLTDTT